MNRRWFYKMLKKLSIRIVNWQIKQGNLKQEEQAIYEYAYEILLNQIINLLFASLIAWYFRMPIVVAVFLAIYIPLRSYSGGYHATTNWGCTLVSAFILVLICGVYPNIPQEIAVLYPVLFVISGVCIFLFAPVPDINKPLDQLETRKYKIFSRIIWGVESLLGIFLYCMKVQIGLVIAMGHGVFTIMLLLGIIKYKFFCLHAKNDIFNV